MINILFSTFITNCFIFSYGAFLYIYIFKERITKNNIYEIPIFGVIILSFISLLINFLLPISKSVGTIILSLGILYLIYYIKNNPSIFKKFIKIIIISTIITFLLLAYSNIYRPDGGLYHLPFISILNENKIIFGLSNIHFRFGTTSIIQYLSAIQNNYIYEVSSISIPIASIFSFVIIFFIKNVFEKIKSKEFILSLFYFFISISCLLNYGSFGNYGNDAVSNLYFYIFILIFLENFNHLRTKSIGFFKIFILSIFLFATKAFMSLILMVPFIIFLFQKRKIELFKKISTYICLVIICSWFVRSIIISGCIIYPLKETCYSNLKYYDNAKTIQEASAGEAWAKDWVNQKETKLDYNRYNKQFNWLKTWSGNHLIKIIEKMTPFTVFLLLFFIFNYFKSRNDYRMPKGFTLMLLFSLVMTLIWFLKFPLYRYGSSFLIVSIVSIIILLMKNLKIFPNPNYIKKNFRVLLIIFTILFVSKNILRIYENKVVLNNNIWPDIYSENNSGKLNKFQLLKKSNKHLYYFSKGKLCMYSKSPCSNYNIDNLNKEYIGNYSIYFID